MKGLPAFLLLFWRSKKEINSGILRRQNFQSRSVFQRFSRYLYKRSIQNIIAASFTAVAVTGMIFLGVVFYMRYDASVRSIVEDNNRRVIDQVNMHLDTYLRNMMRISDTMYYRAIKNTDLSQVSIDNQINLLYDTFRDQVVSIVVVKENGELVATAPLAILKKNVDLYEQDWFTQALGRIENFHFSPPHVQNLFEDPNHSYKWVVSMSRAVEMTRYGTVEHGVLLVDMNFSGIEQIFKNLNLGSGGYAYLMAGDGEIIYHPRQQLIYSNLIQENNMQAALYEDGNHLESFQGAKRIVTVKTVGYTGWKIVSIMPLADVSKNYYDFRSFIVFILLFTIFLMIFANFFVSSRIADPIKALEESVKELEKGAMDVDIAVGGSYEIRHLGNTIRSMVDEMRRLMDDIVAEHESKRKSELDALQSQINPHFLYNTLDSIVWMIENERYEGATSMVTALARLFRISLSKGRNIISVSDELTHAKNYLTIQKIRYKNKFTVDINAEPETLGLSTIKLIIQPLLENAIYHGMEAMYDDGCISVSTYIKEGALYIDVADNGIGIPPSTIEKLLAEETEERSGGSGVGLINVHQRIRLCFGNDYGLSIQSEPDSGTTVSIKLPCVPYENIDEERSK